MAKKTPEPALPPPLLTVRQVAELNGESVKSVRRAIAGGVLEAVRVGPSGRGIRVTPEALERARRRRTR